MSAPLTEADLIFPYHSNIPSLSTTLSSLRRSTLSTHNRLASIVSDSEFVASVSEVYNLPLVANERCGSWYIPPSLKASSVYFKSTDGHMGEWGFSLRRLNLQLLNMVEKHGGAVIVDSTRRGKSMPDALSKTVPIWCCVMNRAVFGGGDHALFTPPQAVSESEHAQIEKRIDGFVQQFLAICKPNLASLRSRVRKPLRPMWVTQQSSLPESPPSFPDFHPVVLCTASRRVRGAEASENGYVQGAADDHEAWAHKLTPTLFWKNKELLLNTASDEEAQSVIEKLISEEEGSAAPPTLIRPTSNLYISSSEHVDLTPFDIVISCTPAPLPSASLQTAGIKPSHALHLACQLGKLGARDLRAQLPYLLPFISSLPDLASLKILVCCPTGTDLAVGTALALLCLYADEQGRISTLRRHTTALDKAFVKQRLAWITTSNPALNPSRATLQSVNAVLLARGDVTVPAQLGVLASSSAASAASTQTDNKTVQQEQSPHPQPPTDLPSTLFTALAASPWSFTRTLTSALPSHPSGIVTGTAVFTPCPASSDASVTRALVYAEEGEFVTATGLRFTARRKYVYRLLDDCVNAENGDGVGKEREQKGKGVEERKYIAVHFFDDDTKAVEKGETVGDLFVAMDTLSPDGDGVLSARNRMQHLCAEDLYIASWRFGPGMTGTGPQGERDGEGGGEEEMWWEVRYDVKGPQKNYVSVTQYTLPKKEEM